jgi:tripartite-type tricarboxylate transporter receptor subunit TctC
MRTIRCLAALSSGLVFAFVLAAPALAQPSDIKTWPERTVRLIVPLPPGSGTDIAGRLLAERLSQRWGQSVVVENRQGGDGIPAVTAYLGGRDAHALLLSFAGIITINPVIHERLPYDPASDLVPIVPVVDNFFGVSATSGLQAESLADLVRIAKAQPGKLNWAASPGLPHYAMLALQKSAAIDMVQVPPIATTGRRFRI